MALCRAGRTKVQTYKVLEGFLNQETLDIEGEKLPCLISPKKDSVGLYTAYCDKAFDRLEPGDPFGAPVAGPLMWVNQHLTQPKPRNLHFGILWMRHPYRSDWITIESSPAGHGIRPGLLSYHLSGAIDIYRVDTEAKIRHHAPWALSDWASQSKKQTAYTTYGFLDFPGFALSGLLSWAKILFKEHRLRALQAAELSRFYKLDRSIICTATIWLGYKLCGFDFEKEIWLREWRNREFEDKITGEHLKTPAPQPRVAPLPCVFERAVELGIMEVLYHT
jgi:hypothetical protein